MLLTVDMLQQVVQLSQRDRATHELLRFEICEVEFLRRPFWGGGLRENVDALYVGLRRWKKRRRLFVGDN